MNRKIRKRMLDSLCKRCGECCHRVDYDSDPPTILETYCDQLEWNGKRSKCKLYPNHHGYLISQDEQCVPIQYVLHRAPDCPYNKVYGLTQFDKKSDIMVHQNASS